MQNITTAVVIGRFQPFHNGHFSILKKIEKNQKIKKIIIIIGSSQFKNTPDNLYSLSTRKKIIKLSLANQIKKKIIIKSCPDVFNDKLWLRKILKITGRNVVVYTGNPKVKNIFIKNKTKVIDIKKKIKISGTSLRKFINNKKNIWQRYVSKKAINIINHEINRTN